MLKLLNILGRLFSGGGRSASKISNVKIEWTHPELRATKIDILTDSSAHRLFQLFDGIDRKQEGTAWDTPFYDATITFTTAAGEACYEAKVYLPRASIFPGMWKHPDGVLMYFEGRRPAKLVKLLAPLLPEDRVYPKAIDDFPDVPYFRGIPDFTESVIPIKGDFSRG
jgi:hypothetical protein